MARAKAKSDQQSLYDRDFNLWVEEQIAHLEAGAFERLDLANLIEEIADMARSQKKAIRSDLVVLLTRLLKWRYQPQHRSTGWTGSIVEHRRRIQEEIEDSPSLAGYPREIFERCYRAAREQAAAETGLLRSGLPETSPYTVDQALDPEFLPDGSRPCYRSLARRYWVRLHERTYVVARAKDAIQGETPLYERDFCLWVEEQARLLKEGLLEQLDLVNLIDEIEDLGIHEKKAVESNLVVVLKHLLKYQFQPRRPSRSWLSSIAEHRRRLRNDLATSPSLRPYARERFGECYQDARRQALIETGLAPDALPSASPYTLEQALDPEFLPN